MDVLAIKHQASSIKHSATFYAATSVRSTLPFEKWLSQFFCLHVDLTDGDIWKVAPG
jgi:hypothetical protein